VSMTRRKSETTPRKRSQPWECTQQNSRIEFSRGPVEEDSPSASATRLHEQGCCRESNR
jgi:hypothetical protein